MGSEDLKDSQENYLPVVEQEEGALFEAFSTKLGRAPKFKDVYNEMPGKDLDENGVPTVQRLAMFRLAASLARKEETVTPQELLNLLATLDSEVSHTTSLMFEKILEEFRDVKKSSKPDQLSEKMGKVLFNLSRDNGLWPNEYHN